VLENVDIQPLFKLMCL